MTAGNDEFLTLGTQAEPFPFHTSLTAPEKIVMEGTDLHFSRRPPRGLREADGGLHPPSG